MILEKLFIHGINAEVYAKSYPYSGGCAWEFTIGKTNYIGFENCFDMGDHYQRWFQYVPTKGGDVVAEQLQYLIFEFESFRDECQTRIRRWNMQ